MRTLFLSLALAVSALAQSAARKPVLLELFTSEGCSSCPAADRLLQTLDRTQPIPEANLIVLSEHVDYWNHDGWSDRFSSPHFSARQQAYANHFHLDSVYTPQLVIDGSSQVVGGDRPAIASAIKAASANPKLPLTLTQARVGTGHLHAEISLPNQPNADLYLALAQTEATTNVGNGENAGRVLHHVAVVRLLQSLGKASASPHVADLTIPKNGAPFRLVAFAQDHPSGHILAVTEQPITTPN